jgi:hypothetical protein
MTIADIYTILENLNADKRLMDAGRGFAPTAEERERATYNYNRICNKMQVVYSTLSLSDMQALHDYRMAAVNPV